MMMMTKLPIIGKGIENAIGLPPGNFVSSQEAHSAVSLSEMVSYDIATAEDRPGGLRLVEWLRGYATLQVIADNAAKENAANQFVRLSCDELKSILHRVGLTTEAASCFIDRATLHERSWDLFDQPLIEMADGSYLLFGPAVHTANPARIVLSAIANLSVQLSRKGSAFENDIRSFLKKQPGLEVHNFTATRNNEPFEYDVIVIWGDYLFVLECKNESLSGHKPVQGYYYSLGVRSHVKQVKRLVTALEVYPDILLNSVGPDLSPESSSIVK